MPESSSTGPQGANPLVFISYQRESAEAAAEVRIRLASAGFPVWQDVEGIRHTDRWSVAIDHALRQAERIIVLLTPKSMQSEEVFNEWFYAYRQHKPIHCLLVEKCEPHYQLLPFQYLDWRDPSRRDWDRLMSELRLPFEWPALARRAQVIGSPYAPQRTLPQALQALHEALLRRGSFVALRDEEVREIASQRPDSETAYRLSRYAAWCAPGYELDERFVRLTLLLDQGSRGSPRFAAQGPPRRYNDLRQLLAEEPAHALVLLGDPGAGKSTLLRRLEMESVVDALGDAANNTITLFVSLSEYGLGLSYDRLPEPIDWLEQRWSSSYPALQSLDELLREGRMLLLLDALNEMPHDDSTDYRRRADLWRAFLYARVRGQPGNRAVFACRTLDYGAVLSTDEYPIPQVRLEPMSRDQVREYLESYAPEQAEAIWATFEDDPRQFDLFRLPYWLKMLVERARRDGSIPKGRAEALDGFVYGLLAREVQRRNPLFERGPLLGEDDLALLREPLAETGLRDLPGEGSTLVPSLTTLAYAIQERAPGEDKGSVLMRQNEVLAWMPPGQGRDILRAGCAMSVLEDVDRRHVRFYHQLLQEFFAARRLAVVPRPELVRVEWRADRVRPALEEVRRQIAESDPLPLLPGTGWEETMALAAAMASDPDSFVRALLESNLPLAGRCAAAPDVALPEALRDEIRWALVRRTRDAVADLRARIAAGLTLGPLGDPRFQRRRGPYGDYLLPPLIIIPDGAYPIGSLDPRFGDEQPPHTVSLQSFRIGQFPVTNAEYALFMVAGGYDDERWWDTPEAKIWRRGEDPEEGPKQQWREDRKARQEMFRAGRVRQLLEEQRISAEIAANWQRFAWMDEAEFEAFLAAMYYPQRHVRPRMWDDSALNNHAQPVTGLCWYEARAYCAWLAAQTGLPFRLPTEAEWEAAAGGQQGRRYAYGDDLDVARANTFESHLRRSTPVGIYPGGDTPEGVADLTGNVWNWTSTVYRPYPYDGSDGREDAQAPNAPRVVRGGSWDDGADYARSACRSRNYPSFRGDDFGFRVTCT